MSKLNVESFETGVIYCGNENERYLLGNSGEKPLICIGINPSTAALNDDNTIRYDPTTRNLEEISNRNGFDSWIMLNIFPQRTPNPAELPTDAEYQNNAILRDMHRDNLQIIDECIKNHSNILLSWGNLINREYLKNCLLDIYRLLSKKENLNYYRIGELTAEGNPMHIAPINTNRLDENIRYVLNDCRNFNEEYIKNIRIPE